MKPLLTALAFSTLAAAFAADDYAPTLKVLPLGSTLSDVTVPQFDKDRKRAGFLKAELMKILSDGEDPTSRLVDCQNVSLRVFRPDGSELLAVDTPSASYRLSPGILRVDGQILARGERFTLSGSAATFHPASRRGFVHGPLECRIQPEPQEQAQSMKIPPIFLALATCAITAAQERPAPLTGEELELLEKGQERYDERISERRMEAGQESASAEGRAKKAGDLVGQFAKVSGDNGLATLIQNEPEEATAEPVADPEAIENPDLKITCQGGAFFDGEENVLVFLKEIEVSEYRFNLKAGKDLKLFFTEIDNQEEAADQGDDEDTDFPKIQIGDIALLSASGGVQVTGKDQKGNPFFARADQASYDEKSKNLILKGGKPYYRGSVRGTHVIALEANQRDASVRINLADKTAPQVDLIGEGWTIPVKEIGQ